MAHFPLKKTQEPDTPGSCSTNPPNGPHELPTSSPRGIYLSHIACYNVLDISSVATPAASAATTTSTTSTPITSVAPVRVSTTIAVRRLVLLLFLNHLYNLFRDP